MFTQVIAPCACLVSCTCVWMRERREFECTRVSERERKECERERKECERGELWVSARVMSV